MKTRLFRSLLASLGLACTCHVALASPPADPSTELSLGLSTLPAVVVSGTLEGIAASGEVVIAAIHGSGEVSTLVLRDASSAGTASLEISAQMARDLGLAVGSVVEVVGESAGYALICAGRLVAFVPNAAGRALLRHARVD